MLGAAEQRNQSLLCVGLDPDVGRLPAPFAGDASRIFDFCAAIVDATADVALAYKPQIAYFAANRAEAQLERLVQHIRRAAPHVPVILDSKRGDIGSTAEQYAIEAFERYGCDAVTLSPFMGRDSFEPYLKRHGKGAFLLCRTSNPGGNDLQFQRLRDVEGQPLLYEHIAQQTVGQQQPDGHDEQRLRHVGLGRHGVDQVLQQHRHADVGHLGAHHEGQRRGHPPLVLPEVGEQAAQGRPVGAIGGRRRMAAGRMGGRKGFAAAAHGGQSWLLVCSRLCPCT